jgi:type III secretion system-like peptide-binding chaperone
MDQKFDNVHTTQEVIDGTIAKVKSYMDKNYPSHIAFEDGTFVISSGSAQVMVIVRPFLADEACVEMISTVVTGAEITLELSKFLLRKNAELHFGAFGLLFDDTITFAQAITGANLDENEFCNTLDSVAVLSDYYDDVIVEMAGGKKASELSSDNLED